MQLNIFTLIAPDRSDAQPTWFYLLSILVPEYYSKGIKPVKNKVCATCKMKTNISVKEAIFSVLTDILNLLERYISLVFGLPTSVFVFALKLFEIRASLIENIRIPEMIIIQDYLGTIVEESEDDGTALGDIFMLSFFNGFRVLCAKYILSHAEGKNVDNTI